MRIMLQRRNKKQIQYNEKIFFDRNYVPAAGAEVDDVAGETEAALVARAREEAIAGGAAVAVSVAAVAAAAVWGWEPTAAARRVVCAFLESLAAAVAVAVVVVVVPGDVLVVEPVVGLVGVLVAEHVAELVGVLVAAGDGTSDGDWRPYHATWLAYAPAERGACAAVAAAAAAAAGRLVENTENQSSGWLAL